MVQAQGFWQTQIKDLELAHSNICLIYELLEHMKRPLLRIKRYRISMTQDNNKKSKSSPSEDPGMTV